MRYSLVLLPAAESELDDAALWYERRRRGLGHALIEEVQEVFRRILAQPDSFEIADNEIRRASVDRFPYSVYYRVKADQVVVISVFHSSRDPAIWHRGDQLQ